MSDYWSVPFLATTHRVARRRGGGGRAGVGRGHRRRAAGHHRLRRTLRSRTRAGGARRPRGAAGPHAEGRAGAARRGLDAGGLGGGRGRGRPRRARQPRARPRAGRAVDRAPRRGPRSPCGATCARVAVVGPCAADPLTFMGCYAFATHVLPRFPGYGLGVDVPSAVEALRAELPDADVVRTHRAAPSAAPTGPGSPPPSPRPATREVCVALVGDRAGLFGHGTSGEGCDAADLRLPGVQAELLGRAARHRHPRGRGRRVRAALRPRRRPRRCSWQGGGPRPGVHAGRGGRRRDRRGALGPGPAGRAAAGADPPRGGRTAEHLPATPARRRRERGHQLPGRHPAVPLRLRPLLHHVRPSTTCGSARPRCRPTAR